MNQQPQDALIDAYRRASAAEAGQPAAATREAILAAAMAAARRAPAANASRYWPRMAAGVAVLGIGVLLWRQTDHRMPGDAPVVMAPATTEAERAADPAPATAPLPASASASSTVPDRRAASGRPDTPVADASPTTPIPAPPPAAATQPDPFPGTPRESIATSPPAPPVPIAPLVVDATAPPQRALNAADDVELAERSVSSSGTVTPESASARPPGVGQPPRAGGGGPGGAAPRAGGGARGGGPASAPGIDRVTLLRQHFPVQYQSDAPHSLWLVQNAAGELVRSGELAPGQRLEDIVPQPVTWQTGTVRNARGQLIELAIARLP